MVRDEDLLDCLMVEKSFTEWYAVSLVKPIGRTGGLRVISQFGKGLSPLLPVLILPPKSILCHPLADTGRLTVWSGGRSFTSPSPLERGWQCSFRRPRLLCQTSH